MCREREEKGLINQTLSKWANGVRDFLMMDNMPCNTQKLSNKKRGSKYYISCFFPSVSVISFAASRGFVINIDRGTLGLK